MTPDNAADLPPNTFVTNMPQTSGSTVDAATPGQIPKGQWQRIAAFVFFAIGIMASLAATPFNGAGAFAALCLTAAGSLFFWGILLRYLAIIEAKLDGLVARRFEQ